MQTMQSKRYTLPGEEPMTWRAIARVAGFLAGWALMLSASAGVVVMLADAAVKMVGYP